MKLIGLSGKARSGKTTLARELEKQFAWKHVALANQLKERCRYLFNLSKEQTDGDLKDVVDLRYSCTPRQILIDFGKFCRRYDPDFWIKTLQAEILKQRQAQLTTFVIGDVRFINEAEWIKKHGGYVIRLNRPVEWKGDDIDDESENQLDDYPHFDWICPESMNVDIYDIKPLAEKVASIVSSRV